MNQYPVPQFIEQEGKIIFFLSFKQFFYLAAGGAICFFLYYTLPLALFIILGTIVMVATVGLAFVQLRGMSIPQLIMGSLGFAMGGKNYIWKKRESPYPFKPISHTRIKKIEKAPVLQAQQSQLRKAKTSIELKTK